MGLSVGKDCAAFAGGDLLVGVEAEDGEIAEAANAALVEFCTNGFAGVLDDREIVSLGEIAESMHVGGDSEGVNDQDGAGSPREDTFDG